MSELGEYVVIWEPKERPGSAQIMGRSHHRVEAINAQEAVEKCIGAFDPTGSFWVVPMDRLERVKVETRYVFTVGNSS